MTSTARRRRAPASACRRPAAPYRWPAGLALAALLLAPVGCSRPAADGAAADPEVLAIFDGGRITVDDLDRAILELPPAERHLPADGAAGWYEDRVRELALDRILRAEAELAGVDRDPDFVDQVEETRRQLVAEAYLERNLPPFEAPDEAALRERYREQRERFDRPARRMVVHLFRRFEPGAPRQPVIAEVEGYRRQVLAGHSLARLAAEHSDSESRHREGRLGWVDGSQLAPELAEVLFALPEGVPSEPLVTAEGVHLFLVERAVEAKVFSFEEVRAVIARELIEEVRRQRVAEIVEALPMPAGSFVPDADELRSLTAAGDPRTVVLRLGDFDLTLDRFRRMLARARQANPSAAQRSELAMHLLEAIAARERIVQTVGAELADDPAVTARLEAARRRELVVFHSRRRLALELDRDPQRLEGFYETNRMRFATPLRLRVERLSVPLRDDAVAVMARLEQLPAAVESGRTTLAAAAAELGGRIDELDGLTLAALSRQVHPKAALFAANLATGKVSPPFTTADALVQLRVLERREPEPRPLASVRDAVRSAYLDLHAQDLYRDWSQKVLDEAGFELFPEHVAALAGTPEPTAE